MCIDATTSHNQPKASPAQRAAVEGPVAAFKIVTVVAARSVSVQSANSMIVTKRRSSRACIGNPKPEQETIKGTHAQETSAYQRRPSTQHTAQGSNPPSRALYMQVASQLGGCFLAPGTVWLACVGRLAFLVCVCL